MVNIDEQKLNLYNKSLSMVSPVNETPLFNKISTWCDVVNVTSSCDLSENYQSICQRHNTNNKWVLMINPESESLSHLSSIGKIDPRKILKVDSKKVNIDIEHIKSALLKGTCAAIILSNTHYNSAEMYELTQYAIQGKTQCVFLKQVKAHQQKHFH